MIDADQLEEQMRMSLSMEPIDFVVFTLTKILASRGPSSANDFQNFASLLGDFPHFARTFVKIMSESPESECSILLSNLIEYWLKCAADKFPKTAAGLPEAEI